MNKKLDYILVIFLFLIALLIRLKQLYYIPPILISDDAILMTMARYFHEGKILGLFHPTWMPLYPFISSILFPLVRNWSYAASLTSVIAGALLVIPIYLIGKNFAGRRAGFVAGFLTVFLTLFFITSRTTYTESLLAFVFWTAILFYLLAIDRNSKSLSLLSGLFFGFTFLTKTEGFITMMSIIVFNLTILSLFLTTRFKNIKKIFPLIIFLLLFLYLFSAGFIQFISVILIVFLIILYLNKKNFKTDFKYLKIMFVALIGFFSVYLSFNFVLSYKYQKPLYFAKASGFLNFPGYWTLNKSKTSTWVQDMNSPDTFNPNSEFANRFTGAAIEKQDYIVKDALNKISTWLKIMFGTSIFLSAPFFIGLYWLILKNKDTTKKIFLLFIVFWTMVFMAFIAYYPDKRYVYWFSPIISLGISFGFNYLQSFLKNPKLKIFLLLFFLTLIIKIDNTENYLQSEKLSRIVSINYQELMKIFLEDKPLRSDSKLNKLLENKRIVARLEKIGFDAKSFLIYSPETANFEEFLSYIKRWKAQYVIASYEEISGSLNYLYLNPKNYPFLKLVYKGKDLFVYEVLY